MRYRWIGYIATGLLAAGAGVAIAGLPSDVPNDLVIDEVPATTSTTSTTTTTTVAPAPSTTAAPPPTEPAVETTAAPATAVAETTTTEPPPTTTTIELVDRSAVDVGVANANGRSGIAGAMVDRLRPYGYTSAFAIDAESPSATSRIFYIGGLEGEASRLAQDTGITPPIELAPMSEAPALSTDSTFELLVVLGLDYP